MPAGLLAQPGRRQVARCVGLVVAAAPACPVGARIAVQPGTDACEGLKAGLPTPLAKPQPPACVAPAKLKPDAGAGGADRCIETRIVAPAIAIQLALPWGFTL
jgi:hypothetical protein